MEIYEAVVCGVATMYCKVLSLMCLLRCMYSEKLCIVGLLKTLLQQRCRKQNCKHFHKAAEENCDILDQLPTTVHRDPLCEHSSSSASKALWKLKNFYLHKHVSLFVWMKWITFVQQVPRQLNRRKYYVMHLKWRNWKYRTYILDCKITNDSISHLYTPKTFFLK